MYNTHRLRLCALAAACQLLIACTSPTKPAFLTHFTGGEADFSQDLSFPDGDKKSEDGKDGLAGKAKVMLGDGKVLGDPQQVAPLKSGSSKFNFEDAPIAQVARVVLGDILGVPHVLHPPLQGNITMITPDNVSTDQAMYLLEAALQANGMAVVRDTRGTYHVGKVEALRSLGANVTQAKAGSPLPAGVGTVIIPLDYIGAEEMAAILRPMVGQDSIVRVDGLRNILVMRGSRAQAEGWLDMVRTFDVNLLKGMSVGIFPLRHISPEEAVATLQMAVSGAAAASGGAAAGGVQQQGIPGQPGSQIRSPAAIANVLAGAGSNAGAASASVALGSLRIMPIGRLRSVLIITPKAAFLEEAKEWIARLDQPGLGDALPQLHIYNVQNGNAKHLAGVLAGIFGSGSGTSTQRDSGVAPGLNSTSTVGGFGSSSGFGSGSSSGFGFGSLSSSSGSGLGGGLGTGLRAGGLGQQGTNRTQTSTQASATDILGGIRVMADELNNSVLVWGTGLEFERIQAALKRLDLPPTQVLIEASIIEVTLNDSLRYGLQWAFSDTHGSKTDKGVLSDEDGGVLGAALKGFSYTISNSSGNVRAVLNALSSKTSIKVVASPTLMVMDNHTASIMVGQQQPIQSGTTINNTGQVITSSIQYKDTGVSLQVTPSVNSGNMVSMTVDQSVTDVGDKDLVTNQRSFLQRQLSSRVAVRSGESIVMGGLIQESNTSGRGGIPVLHELPVVGNLFGSTTNEGRRTELLVIITPKVVRSDVDVKQVSEDLRTQMSGLRKILTPVPAVAPAQP